MGAVTAASAGAEIAGGAWARLTCGAVSAAVSPSSTSAAFRCRQTCPMRQPEGGSVIVVELLQLIRRALLQQRKHQQDPRLLRIQLVGGDEAELVVVELDVAADRARCHPRAAHDRDAALGHLR